MFQSHPRGMSVVAPAILTCTTNPRDDKVHTKLRTTRRPIFAVLSSNTESSGNLCSSNMAVPGSPDWSVASTKSCRRTCKAMNCFVPAYKSRPFLAFPASNSIVCHVKSSSCPSPSLEEQPKTEFPIINLDLRLQDSQPFATSDSEISNQFLCGVLNDPLTQGVAYEYYKKVKERKEFEPERPVLKLLLRYLVRSKKWSLIESVFHDCQQYNVFPDGYTCSRLIGICVKARKFRMVETLLEACKSDRVTALFSFESAMRGYNKLHMYRRTILAYEKMKSEGILMNSRCYCHIIKAYQKVGDVDKVVALFQEFGSRNFSSKLVTGQVYKMLCESLGKAGRPFEALEYFRNVTKKGISKVEPPIYSSLICSFANMREIDVAQELFKEAEEKKMLTDPEVFLKLILMYIEEGMMEKTVDIVRIMKKTSLRMSDCVFCAIVNGFAKRKGFPAAVKIYEQLTSEGCEPGQVTYASVINAYYRSGFYSKAEMVFLEMEQKGFDKCLVAYSTIVAMYGKTGRLRDALRLVAKMKLKGCEPNVWIYNSLLDMHGRVKNLRRVEKLWKEMKRRKVAPDKVTYTSVISAYNRAKEFEKCVNFYNEYRRNQGVIDKAMAGIMVGVFSKTEQVDELLKLLRDMKSEGTPFDRRLYLSVLNSLRDAGLLVQTKWLQESFEAKHVLR
ncbi:hypothetical protein K2173_006792 [Erythroxylum novogranatense]|uniref:Pentatricopeptide repeat-containing protein n=1 Tax=Erythroxylum novogranatense TaxID=1862640 RepID=A0AAV8SXY1_9ROSI|nr:hypothetical protein K2173_006792 [Erythroxylum novogranatense]